MVSKKRILFILDSDVIGGALNLTMDTAFFLDEKGYSVGLVFLSPGKNAEYITGKIIGRNVKIYYLNIHNSNLFTKLTKLRRLIAVYDYVNSCTEWAHFYCSILSYIVKNKIWIATFHGIDMLNIVDKYLHQDINSNVTLLYKIRIRYFQRVLFKKYDHFIAVSISVKNYLINFYKIPANIITVIYYGINLQDKEYSCGKQNAVKYGLNYSYKVAYVGRLTYAKGIEDIVEVARELKNEGFNFELLLIGDGERREFIEELITRYNLNNTIKLTGVIQNVTKFLEDNDIFLLPSYSEGMPLTVLEAMYSGNIVLCSDVGGLPELIVDNYNGFMFTKGDITFFKEKLKYILNNYEKLSELKKNATLTIELNFDFKKNIDIFLYLLENIK